MSVNLFEKTFTVCEAAKTAGISKSMMYEYIDTKQCWPIRRFGGKTVVPESSLKEFIRVHTVTSDDDEERILKIEAKAERRPNDE
jgi:predicted transcriptional regulator